MSDATGLTRFIKKWGAGIDYNYLRVANYGDCDMPSVMTVAVHNDNIEISKRLLKHHAARSAEMVRLLLDYDANPDEPCEGGSTPLHWHVFGNDIEALREMVNSGATADLLNNVARNWKDESPLFKIMKPGTRWTPVQPAVEILLEAGADVKQLNAFGQTLLHPAAAAGKRDVIRLLVKYLPEECSESGLAR
ncbi:ankyrin repeat-containing domain protein [Sphaerosporella brunnea]|uniref:Ankyrin repeat-containing domain protein n=1 Tax=Sphaerosporella brunnea TaxID=1250544 RepID=A0A5J5ECZ5_9PEZI|nr:ankyrin repeat-containing domain protein [Sphaerosporella brunnea]